MKPISALLLLVLFAPAISAAADERPLYRDPKQPVEARVDDLLKKLTPEEKLDALSGPDNFYLKPVPRLGIPKIVITDGPVGVRNYGQSTQYPASIALAASWDEALATRFGESIAGDCKARGVHIFDAPGVNIYRAPLCGRNFEYLGEDPLLAGRIASAEIRAVQARGVAAVIKHFACNNSEVRRSDISNDVDERALREIYLPAYEMAVREAHVWYAMSAYNLLNGSHCTANDWLNNQVLKKEWGFAGVLMSDWHATHDTLGPAVAGLDLEMPSGIYFDPAKIKPLIDEGKISWRIIDDKVRRNLRVIIAMGWLDHPVEDKSIPLDDPTSSATALQIAREGSVLLKNDGLLPIDRAATRSIAVLGPNAAVVASGLGSSRTKPFHSASLLDGLKAKAGSVKIMPVEWESPDPFFKDSVYESKPHLEVFATATKKEPAWNAEVDSIDLKWNPAKPTLGLATDDKPLARWTTTIAPKESGRYEFAVNAGNTNIKILLDGTALWDSSREARGTVLASLEAGRTYALRVEAEVYKKKRDLSAQFGWGTRRPIIPEADAKAVASADAAVVAVGFNTIIGEGEGADRQYALPGRQEELIRETARLNRHTIVILNAGGSVATADWIGQAAALLHAFYSGQEGGTALAEILFGDVNPGRRLPFSWEKKWEDCAAYGHYAGATGKNVEYAEGIFLGYRGFDTKKIEPLFPFGHGLSYTTFDFKNLKAEKKGNAVKVSLDLTNSGPRPGDEVVQLYIGQPGCSIPRPVRELKGFSRFTLKPGESRKVEFTLEKRAFSFFDPKRKEWTVEPGEFIIEAGASSRDIRQTAKLAYGN